MKLEEKISLFKKLNCDNILNVTLFYEVLEQCGDLKANYHD